MKRIFGKSRGQMMVLYAGALAFALAAAVALGTDIAVMYVNWQHSQKVADAAALAGANYLGGGITYTDPNGNAYPTSAGCAGEGADDASKVACTYAVNNGLPASTVTISETASTIKVVSAQTGLPYFFGNALGSLGSYAVSATAVANSPGPVNTVSHGLVPLGLQCTTPCPGGSFVAGQPVSFGHKFISAQINLPGNWGWLDLDGSGGAGLRTDLANGASTSYSVGQSVSTNPGGKNGPIKQGLDSRFAGCPNIADPCAGGGNPNSIPAGDPCLVVVPVVDFAAAGKAGKTSMPIEQFAEVYLDPKTTDGNTINGCYVSSTVGDTIAGGTPSAGPNAAPLLIQ